MRLRTERQVVVCIELSRLGSVRSLAIKCAWRDERCSRALIITASNGNAGFVAGISIATGTDCLPSKHRAAVHQPSSRAVLRLTVGTAPSSLPSVTWRHAYTARRTHNTTQT